VTLRGAYPGIRVTGDAINTVITGNSCNDNRRRATQKYGIEIERGTSGCVVKDNVCTGNVKGDILSK
jgi:hypothetical protein